MSLPGFAQDVGVDPKTDLEIKRKELNVQIEQICDHPLTFPRSYYLSSKDKGDFYEYARNIDKSLDMGLRKSPSMQHGYATFAIRIASTGVVTSIEILKSEGSEEIGELVKRLVQSSAPYATFSPKMKSAADEIVYFRTVKTNNYRIPPNTPLKISEEEIRARKDKLKELTEVYDRLYKNVCGSRGSTQ